MKNTPSTAQSPSVRLRGWLCQQMVRCGRPNCRCASGRLHGPYYYLFEFDGERVRKRYVRKRDLASAQAACAAWRTHCARLDLYNQIGWEHAPADLLAELQENMDQGLRATGFDRWRADT